MRALCNALLTLLLTQLCPSLAQAATAHTALERAYGYQIGDLLTQEVSIELGAAEAGAVIEAQSLPKLGKQGVWVELVRRGEIRRHEDESLHFSLHYQVMNAPREVAVVFLPSPKLNLVSPSGQSSEVKLPAQGISVSPMSKDEAFARAGMESLRPEQEVMPEPAQALKGRAQRWLFAAITLALMAMALAWWRRRLLQQGPFARAAREVRRTRDAGQAIRLMHSAFNESAGHTVFAQSLEDYLRARPQFAALRAEITHFFFGSRAHFFSLQNTAEQSSGDADLQSIVRFAHSLARAEKAGAA
jgi:mxaA protein